MKNLGLVFLILSLSSSLTYAQVASIPGELPDELYQGSVFSEVWEQVASNPFGGLPQNVVSIKKFFQGTRNLLLEASRRTLSTEHDLLPYFEKLVHSNGICLKGSWNITEDNPYSGYFRPGTEAPIIVRASTSTTNPNRRNGARSFGLAGKIYPTNDPNHGEKLKTANFFTINDLGGTREDYFLNAENTNDILSITPSATGAIHGLVAAAVFVFFPIADDSNGQTALIRELYPISELGEKPGAKINTPVWLKIIGSPATPRVLRDDFRDELDIANYPEGLKLDIVVASEGSRVGDKNWNTIGHILLDDSVVSVSCDHNLHFRHPPARDVHTNVLENPISE